MLRWSLRRSDVTCNGGVYCGGWYRWLWASTCYIGPCQVLRAGRRPVRPAMVVYYMSSLRFINHWTKSFNGIILDRKLRRSESGRSAVVFSHFWTRWFEHTLCIEMSTASKHTFHGNLCWSICSCNNGSCYFSARLVPSFMRSWVSFLEWKMRESFFSFHILWFLTTAKYVQRSSTRWVRK